MSEMSHDFPPEPNTEVLIKEIETAVFLTERLLGAGKNFTCVPGEDIITFRVTERDAKFISDQLMNRDGKLVVMYKGHVVRCYGKVNKDQNVWWSTEDEQGILTHGYPSWDDAVKDFIDNKEIPVIEMGAA